MLSLSHWSARAGNKDILHDIALDIAPGTITAIMGPNGSGKSTLARTVMGDPTFTLGDGARLMCDGTDLTHASADVRAREGIFLSAQSPLAISGVTVRDLMRAALTERGVQALDVKKRLERTAAQLAIPDELLDRSLNDGFSGGERKKMEVLQMALVDPRYIILDEIDTGVDVDALKTIATFLHACVADTDKALVIITHATKILDHLTPTHTVVLRDGRIAAQGDAALAYTIEQEGFAATHTL